MTALTVSSLLAPFGEAVVASWNTPKAPWTYGTDKSFNRERVENVVAGLKAKINNLDVSANTIKTLLPSVKPVLLKMMGFEVDDENNLTYHPSPLPADAPPFIAHAAPYIKEYVAPLVGTLIKDVLSVENIDNTAKIIARPLKSEVARLENALDIDSNRKWTKVGIAAGVIAAVALVAVAVLVALALGTTVAAYTAASVLILSLATATLALYKQKEVKPEGL